MPVTLSVLLAVAGVSLYAADSGPRGVLLVGTLDGSQLGLLLIMIATGCGVVALFQSAALAARLRRPLWRFLVRVVAGLLVLAALPFGCGLVFVAAFASVNSYQRLAVPGHTVVVRTLTWHHRSLAILEQDGLFFHSVALCGDPLPVDGYDAFAAGQYDVVARGGHDVLRFAKGPRGSFTGEAALGARLGDDVSASCG